MLELLASGEHLNLANESDSIRRLHTKLEKHQALKFLSKQVFLSGKLRINLAEGTVDAKAEEFFVHLGGCAKIGALDVNAMLTQAHAGSIWEVPAQPHE